MLDSLLECLPDLVVLADPDGVVQRLNPAAETFFAGRGVGCALAALVGDTLAAVRAPAWRGPVHLIDAAGRSVPHTVLLRRGGDGVVVVARREADAAARDVAARDAAERELVARDEFVAGLGHELRTPLNAVLGFAQLLQLEDLPADQRDGVERILTAGRHMQSLLDDVLDLARVRTGGVDLDVGPVPVLDVARAVVDLVAPLADPRGIRRVLEPASDCAALADRRRLWQVLLNLLGNAVKYGREGGTVRVSVAPVGDRVRIEVEDDGPGIDPTVLPRLFQPFERLGQERGSTEGTGLGLSVSQTLVTAMNGTLTATSRLGSGTRFVVELPAVDRSAFVATEDPTPAGDPVLVHVSANPGARALVASALRTRLAVRVLSAERSADAVALVRDTRAALVLLDAELPDAAPAELLHRLGSDPLTALVPVVVLAFDPEPATRLRLRAAGAREVLPLPLELPALFETVGRLLP